MYKTFKMWKKDHAEFKKQAANNDRQMIEEFSALVNNRDIRLINGRLYKVMPMESDFGRGTSDRAVKSAKWTRTNRVIKDNASG
jgi:hypothetical protein